MLSAVKKREDVMRQIRKLKERKKGLEEKYAGSSTEAYLLLCTLDCH